MIKNFKPQNFESFFFKNKENGKVTMSSACRGGGGCYQCKCSPRKKNKSEDLKPL